MSLDIDRARRLIADFELNTLFIEELGWDRYQQGLEVSVDDRVFVLEGIAEKRGMVAFRAVSPDGVLPDYKTRREIERKAARSIHEHLIVYTSAGNATHVWQWVRRERGRPAACREQRYNVGQSGEALIQRLGGLAFSLEEEAGLTIVDVTQRARAAFDVERITRRFYDRFKAEHDSFLGFIAGVDDQAEREWYASVSLNRLMFIYFIQKKGFLNGDRDYLRNRLRRMQEGVGQDQFLSFYRHFLLRLFHEGLGRRGGDPELDELIGVVPYLNGGLFDVHELERANPEIEIPDEAFEGLFDFFDSYQWHLDDRAVRADNEINPDVLGYIFEKYVNQKQMGAYYTKEDITGYITSRTVLPALFRRLDSFEKGSPGQTDFIWALLEQNPERYIPAEVRLGCDQELPSEIAAGLTDNTQRTPWNSPAPELFALPTELWREVLTRRDRYQRLVETLAGGEVRTASDLVALNLDIEQWALDILEASESPEFLLWFYAQLEDLTVLDPTCGSGAFLFATLNILEPLYEATLDRMQAFLAEGVGSEETTTEFQRVALSVDSHPNRAFFILKTVVLNNLYGVDIMEEAVEICKLRLFLKLVAQVDDVQQIEPLPDIDFNIRAGNAFVGFVDVDPAGGYGGGQFDLSGLESEIAERLEVLDAQLSRFQTIQTTTPEADESSQAALKDEVRESLEVLAELLDHASYTAQTGATARDQRFELWRVTHQPFHWLVAFHEILRKGGFDAVVGNPPYVEYRDVKNYDVADLETLDCADLYAFTLERALQLVADDGWLGFIVPLSAFSVERFKPLQDMMGRSLAELYVSSWSGDAHPAKLFEGVDKRLQILVGRRSQGSSEAPPRLQTSRYIKWYAAERPALFQVQPVYTLAPGDRQVAVFEASLPKLDGATALTVLDRLQSTRTKVGQLASATGEHELYYTRKASFFLQFLNFVPDVFDSAGTRREPSELKRLRFRNRATRDLCLAALSSSLFYWFFIVNSDCRNLNKREVVSFPVPDELEVRDQAALEPLVAQLMTEYRNNSELRTVTYAKKGAVTVQYFNFRPSKPTLDEIDALLAPYYGLDPHEVSYVVNYDLKYRLGLQA